MKTCQRCFNENNGPMGTNRICGKCFMEFIQTNDVDRQRKTLAEYCVDLRREAEINEISGGARQ